MVKVFGLVFAALLACAHFAAVQGDAYYRPLSMFRDYDPAWIGYALFGVLVAIGFETVRTAFRVQAELHAAVYLIATGLLAVVAATPSYDSLHATCALIAMAMMFAYYAVLLYCSDSMFWLEVHLLTPTVLMMASRLESFGIWQKGMILYFLAATVVHQGLLAQRLPKHKRKTAIRGRSDACRKQAA
jgi:hypothetical protein